MGGMVRRRPRSAAYGAIGQVRNSPYLGGMARMSPDERRDAIVAAALAVMERQGIAGTTVRDVAAELGTSSGLIHHYFDSMDDLLAEAFARVAGRDLADMRDAVERGRDPIERLSLFFDVYARTEETSILQVWLDAWAEASRRPTIQRISRHLNEEWHALLVVILDEGVAQGAMVCDDPVSAAWRILSLLDGLMLQAVAHEGAVTFAQVDAWSRTGAERELGLRPGMLGGVIARA